LGWFNIIKNVNISHYRAGQGLQEVGAHRISIKSAHEVGEVAGHLYPRSDNPGSHFC